MAARTREQNEHTKLAQEVESLQTQLAFLGGLVVGAIHSNNLEGLDSAIDHFPYLQTLPSFVAMRGQRAKRLLHTSEEGGA